MVVVTDVGGVIETDVIVAVGDVVLEDENGKNYRLGSRDALLEITGHQVVLLDGVAIAIHVNC
jgi:hypothetical protein